MSVFFRSRQPVERRSVSSLPFNYGGTLGQVTSQDTALSLAPVFAAVRHICDYASTLPLKGYRRDGDSRSPMATLPRLFADLQAQGRLVPWLAQCVASLVVRGNAVGYVNARDGFDFPSDITWLSMDRVSVDESSGVPRWSVDGRKVTGPAPGRLATNLDLVHIPWITVPGQTLGLSPIAYYAATVNAGLGAQEYGATWLRNGGYPPAIFRNTEKVLKPGAAETIRERLKASIKRHEPLVVGRDWDFSGISIPPNETGFIEVQRLSCSAIASIYGLAPEDIGGEAPNSLTYSTEELRQIKRAANMRPYLARLEAAFASWLPNLQYVRFNVDSMIRADLRTRWDVNQIRVAMGAASINEIRAQEDEPPVPGGDSYTTQPTQLPPAHPSSDSATPPRRLSVVDYEGR